MKAKCLCEAVSLEADDSNHVEACHCGMCRRWSGGPLLGLHGGTNVVITGEEFVSRYASSEWAERVFCSKCGTHLFYHLKATGEHFLPAGLFQADADFDFKQQIFIDQKPNYYEFSNDTENLTEEQVFERYAP